MMKELKFRNFIPSLFIFFAAIALSVGSSYINIKSFFLPVPLLIIGLFTGFLVLNFIIYPKATTSQVIQLTITGFFINAIVLLASIFGIKFLNPSLMSCSSDFILSISPLIPAISFLFSFITLFNLVLFEDKTVNPVKTNNQEEKQIKKDAEEKQPEIISFETKNVSEAAQEKIKLVNETEETQDFKPISSYEELYPQAKTEQTKTQESEKYEFDLGLSEVKQPEEDKNSLENNEEFFDMGGFPEIDMKSNETESKKLAEDNVISFEPQISSEANADNTFSLILEDEEESKKPQVKSTEAQDNNDQNFDFIPTDIRLIEAPMSKDNESKAKIASIGKLLVNNRDIEGVIESKASVSETGVENKTNILSSVSGENIYEKFNQLKQEYNLIKEIALIDKGGFILACDYEDKMKIHITGALIAGAYHTLQNYLSQISFNNPQKIFFETENSNNLIMKVNNEFLFLICDKEFKYAEYGSLEGFIQNDAFSEINLTPLIELNQIINFAMADGTGKPVKTINNFENSEKLSIISSALFENLKVFLMNIQLMKLDRITIFNSEEVLSVQKLNNEIASFITPIDGIIKIADDFVKIEEIYQA